MAGDWIKMRGNLWDDPRVAKIVDMTDSSEAAVIGALYWLWATADQHTEDGIMPGLTLRSIDRKTGVKGFAEALCAIDWLADHPEGVRIVDFEKHNGSSAKKRCQTAKRVANFAAANAKQPQEPEGTNADSVSSALAREREEKEKSREEEIPSVAKATGDKSPPKPPRMDDKEKVFTYGVPILVNGGSTDKAARSFLGGLCKGHGEAAVVQALRDCVREKPIQPLEWLAAALPPEGSEKRKPVETFRERDARLAREKVQAWTPGIAAKTPDFSQPFTIDEVSHVAAIESR